MKTANGIKISVVSPVYRAEDCISQLYQRLVKTLSYITSKYEIILVEDCGGDQSWQYIQEIASKDKHIKAIKLSRNFGQHQAITAGLQYATGDYIVVMDCDLQDQPEEIEKLYNKILEGYDIVTGYRAQRKDSFLKRLSSKLFYNLYSYASGISMDNGITNFGIYSNKVINNFLNFKEQHRFFPIAIKWLGFNSVSIDIKHSKRLSGKSSYTISKLFKCGFDNLISNSGKPLLIMFNFGLLTSFIFFSYGLILILRWFINGSSIQGWTSLIVSMNFIGGIIIMSLGIVGIYIQKMFEEIKGRPLYIIDQTINIK
jgi:dolichol-phosphate mannosyltransferase